MRQEGNLRNEANNAMRTARYLADEPTLRDRVMVPKVYDQWTGESVMTAECVQACRDFLRFLVLTPGHSPQLRQRMSVNGPSPAQRDEAVD